MNEEEERLREYQELSHLADKHAELLKRLVALEEMMRKRSYYFSLGQGDFNIQRNRGSI